MASATFRLSPLFGERWRDRPAALHFDIILGAIQCFLGRNSSKADGSEIFATVLCTEYRATLATTLYCSRPRQDVQLSSIYVYAARNGPSPPLTCYMLHGVEGECNHDAMMGITVRIEQSRS